jgi:hypothetical protein
VGIRIIDAAIVVSAAVLLGKLIAKHATPRYGIAGALAFLLCIQNPNVSLIGGASLITFACLWILTSSFLDVPVSELVIFSPNYGNPPFLKFVLQRLSPQAFSFSQDRDVLMVLMWLMTRATPSSAITASGTSLAARG